MASDSMHLGSFQELLLDGLNHGEMEDLSIFDDDASFKSLESRFPLLLPDEDNLMAVSLNTTM